MSEPTPDPIEAWKAATLDVGATTRAALEAGDALVTALEAERERADGWMREGKRKDAEYEAERVDHAATRRQRDAMAQFCRWLIGMDDPDDSVALEARRTVTLTNIIGRARAAVGSEETPPAGGLTVGADGTSGGTRLSGETPPKETAP